MNTTERILDDGTVETRYYDDDGKLTDIRKLYPPGPIRGVKIIAPTKRGSVSRGY